MKVIVAIAIGVAAIAPQNPPRADPQQQAVGTAVLAGTIVTDEARPQPVRSAIVTLNSADVGVARTAVSDDVGRFVFDALPAGRFVLSASKPAYLTVQYGATRAGRPGVPVAIAAGDKADITLRLPRGSVLTGRILDDRGRSVSRGTAFVYALQYQWQNGRRVLAAPRGTTAAMPAEVDDRGVYRIYGLPPGEYVVLATPGLGAGGIGARKLSDKDFQRAQRELQGGAPGAPSASNSPTVRWAAVFYPGVTTADRLTTIALDPGEERSGVDLTFSLVPVAEIRGSVRVPEGVPAISIQINMVPTGAAAPRWGTGIGTSIGGFASARPMANGTFAIANVAPGDYALVARNVPPARSGGAGQPVYWASAQVSVNGRDVTDVSLELQPAISIPGKVVFDAAPPVDSSRVRVQLSVTDIAGATIGVPPAAIAADGAFTLGSVTPARYAVTVTGVPAGWTIRAATGGGKDVLDAGLEVGAGTAIPDLTITLTDRPTELSGIVQGRSGQPTSDYVVIVFAEDASRWTWQSRWIQAVRPGTNGRYVMTGLPPGRYRLSAVWDVDANEWFDPEFLKQLLPFSIRFDLSDSERKVQDIRAGG
jgi:hypothetical protein